LGSHKLSRTRHFTGLLFSATAVKFWISHLAVICRKSAKIVRAIRQFVAAGTLIRAEGETEQERLGTDA
jgi:hypothetical protein